MSLSGMSFRDMSMSGLADGERRRFAGRVERDIMGGKGKS